MEYTVRILNSGDAYVLDNVASGVFDNDVDQELTVEFLTDARHHLAIALDGDVVVGIASAVHYIHPDKEPELWINEVGITSTHRRQGIGKKLINALFDHGRELGCGTAWVLTERDNEVARRLYGAMGGTEKSQVMVEFSL